MYPAFVVTIYSNANCTGRSLNIGYPAPYSLENIRSYRFSSFKVAYPR
jgi:hypothetical protein